MSDTMLRRSRRRLPATVTALALLALSLATASTVAVTLMAGVSDRHPLHPFLDAAGEPVRWLRRLATHTAWQAPEILAAGAALALVGLILSCCGLWPGRPTVYPLASGPGLAAAGITRDSLRRVVGGSVVSVDGVTQAQVAVRRGAITITAWCRFRDADGLSGRIEESVGQRLDQIDLHTRPQVRIRRVHGQP